MRAVYLMCVCGGGRGDRVCRERHSASSLHLSACSTKAFVCGDSCRHEQGLIPTTAGH